MLKTALEDMQSVFLALRSPICICFLIIVVGIGLGRIKHKDISLGVAGVLVAAIFFGLVLSLLSSTVVFGQRVQAYYSELEDNMKGISDLGTGLFISATGLQSGYAIHQHKGKTLLFVVIGASIALLNYLMMCAIGYFNGDTADPFLLGVFCGAMTSSPGLATLCDNETVNTAAATIGYSSAYFLGVLGTVMSVKKLSVKEGQKESPKRTGFECQGKKQSDATCLMQIGITVFLGYLVGSVELPFVKMEMGSTGGILIFAIFWGAVINRHKPDMRIKIEVLGFIRNIGLMLFFVGIGISCGKNAFMLSYVKYYLYSLILVLFPIFLVWLIKKPLRIEGKELASVVCGVMTSSPGFGILTQNGEAENEYFLYSSAYIGALIMVVMIMNVA